MNKIYLSKREYELASFVAQGLNNAQIAKKMIITNSTVKQHLVNIYSKLGIEKEPGSGSIGSMRVKLTLAYLNGLLSLRR